MDADVIAVENNQTVTVVERWRDTEMIRYIEHPDGAKTVLEHRTDEQRPFVKVNLHYPVPYIGRALSVSEQTGQQNTNGLN